MHSLLKRTGRVLLWAVAVLAGLAVVAAIAGFFIVRALVNPPSDDFGNVEDEAKLAGRTPESMPAAADPYFAAMDKGLLLSPGAGEDFAPEVLQVAEVAGLPPEDVRQAAIRGQNMWLVWTGGNDRFWDFAAKNTAGSFDLLKTMSSHPSQAYGRDNRFRYLGLINEPCYSEAEGPDPDHFGLWLDQRDPACAPDPFADAEAYPGVEIGARGESLPVGSYYGEPTGVIGLRLFPNPDFDEDAAERWDPVRFYEDPDYYNDRDLVRPYRVGMSCAFCHVGPNPIDPPDDVENPRWEELTSNPGAQYFWVDRIFVWNTEPRSDPAMPAPNEGSFLYQVFHTNPPGSLDTSLVSTDYINNPRTMNAVYETLARLEMAAQTGAEVLEGDERANVQFQDYQQTSALASFYDEGTGRVGSMRVLKDGADSVGTLGALNRVYLNIGLFSEEWLLHFRPFIGGQKISPIRIEDAQRNSVYWRATEEQSPDMAAFFLVAGRADRLADAPGGKEILATQDPGQVDHGKEVFAQRCAACHSSKIPEPDPSFGVDSGICEGGGAGPDYRTCWDRYWAWAQSDDFKDKMLELVTATDEDGRETFLAGNYLSNERRVPLEVIGTNACTAIATNGLKGDIWDNFTSSTYKNLPPPGEVTVHHPVSGGASSFQALGNGRGYVRPASLVSLWSTAPYLSNNAVGYEPRYYGVGYDEPDATYATAAYQDRSDPVADASATADPKLGEDAGEAPEAAAYDPATATADADSVEDAAGYEAPGASSGDEPGSYAAGEAGSEYGAGDVQDNAAAPEYAAAEGDDVPAEYRVAYGAYGSATCPSAYPDDPFMPCVENRLAAFDHSIRALLDSQLRRTDTETNEPVPGYIYRTTAPSCLRVPPGFMPGAAQRFSGLLHWLAPWVIDEEGGVALGPFPEGFPINALTNTKLLPDNDEPEMWQHTKRMLAAGPTLIGAFKDLGGQCSPEELADPGVQARAEEVVRESGMIDTLVGLSKCPDYVVNRGHDFGAVLTAEEREALIEYLKHF